MCVEVTDKKQTKTKENWFPGLVVAPNAQVKKKKTNDVPKTLWSSEGFYALRELSSNFWVVYFSEKSPPPLFKMFCSQKLG